jgi:hypothetical protein
MSGERKETRKSVVDSRLSLLPKIKRFFIFRSPFFFPRCSHNSPKFSSNPLLPLKFLFAMKEIKRMFDDGCREMCPLAVFSAAIATCVTINRFTFFCFNCAQLLKINYFTSESSKRERFPSNEKFFFFFLRRFLCENFTSIIRRSAGNFRYPLILNYF